LKVILLHKNITLLIDKVKQNDPEAQEALFNYFSPKMLGVCRQYINDRYYAEDVLLNGFLKVFTKINKYQFKGSFEGWIRRIMINECLTFLRKKNKLIFFDNEQILKDFNKPKIVEDDIDDLQLLIDNLPDGWRIVFNLFAIEGYKHQEIAKLMGITEMASRSRYFKAKKQLQTAYLHLKNKTHAKGY